MLQIDNPFARRSEVPTIVAPEATEQNPETNVDTTKQVADLGLTAVRSHVEVKAPDSSHPVEEWSATDKELAKASAFGRNVEQDMQPEEFGADFKIPGSTEVTSEWDKIDEELTKVSTFGFNAEQQFSHDEFEPDFKIVDTTIDTSTTESQSEKVNS